MAFVAAGLPASISDLLGDDVLTFLRRADRHSLGAVPLDEVAQAIREPLEETGRSIGDDDCRTAAEATNGYPFLIQLVGYRIWRQNPAAAVVSTGDVTVGVAELIAAGLTNKEIANRLVLSPRTAQGHVEHILTAHRSQRG
ncbi:LuxR C-terminal-related transcriptional regulator [Rhodococcus sp. T7]|uniref:LuxR C-terminal-related transcriptional regulator n=1 Tax=Rhodococcus sp. T7 TaxID=627444 RepID=UPI0013CD50F7|nr:LuxR C-terminal-related transcriptional regulator [Rhodococcus sp. T7]KAF0957757.1 hypothetical protein MLGJGCBP_09589 [Rhodococcus sp. T7]KAF0959923.1 hypothetical protein MLGJGCBP_06958 [Rhodococcus sp. T7]